MEKALREKYVDPREHKGVQGKTSSGKFVSLKRLAKWRYQNMCEHWGTWSMRTTLIKLSTPNSVVVLNGNIVVLSSATKIQNSMF
jgi:hypothetical protein